MKVTPPAQTDTPGIEALAAEIEARQAALPPHNTTSLRALRREYSRRIARWSARDVIELSTRLMRSSDKNRFMAYELIEQHRPAQRALAQTDLEDLGVALGTWDAVDIFACYLSGPAWRERQVPDALIEGWAASTDRWWRRAALVSTVPLNIASRGGRGDTERTLGICRLLVADRDDMVVKAMSWALRELARRDAIAVRAFLSQHEPSLAPRVLREVRAKLTTGLKTPKRPSS